jgi:hypothetical protein
MLSAKLASVLGAAILVACSSSSLGGEGAAASQRTAPSALRSTPVAAAPQGAHAAPTRAGGGALTVSHDHEDVLALLRDDDSVIPARPPVHPLHTVYNREAVVPPMCYTRTEGAHNPCYVCHQDKIAGRPNAMDDGALQRAYSFSELGATNHWQNLFEDRSQRIAEYSDEAIQAWVSQDNYSELAARLRDAQFRGYVSVQRTACLTRRASF